MRSNTVVWQWTFGCWIDTMGNVYMQWGSDSLERYRRVGSVCVSTYALLIPYMVRSCPSTNFLLTVFSLFYVDSVPPIALVCSLSVSSGRHSVQHLFLLVFAHLYTITSVYFVYCICLPTFGLTFPIICQSFLSVSYSNSSSSLLKFIYLAF